MSNDHKTPFDNFNLADMQKQFMDAFMKQDKRSNPFSGLGGSASGNNWADAMEFWWRAFKPESANNYDNLFGKMIEQCQTYYALSQHFSKLLECMESIGESSEDMTHFLNEQFQNMESFMAENQQLFSWANLVDQCEQPADLLKNLFSTSPMFTGEVINEVSPELRKLREKFLTMPGLGYSRESQEKMQEALHLWAQYQDNYQEFHAVMSRLNHDALDLMRKRLIKMHKEGENIDSMRQIYNLWVDSNETVYGEFVFTEEYADMNGRLVNSLMAFKNKSHEITEDHLSAMNMPTSSDINALEQRQYELNKQMRAMQSELARVKKELEEVRSGKAVPVAAGQSSKTESKEKKKRAVKNTASTRKKTRKKQKRTSVSTASKSSSSVVDFKESQDKKKKRKQSASKKQTSAANEDSANSKRMINIKF